MRKAYSTACSVEDHEGAICTSFATSRASIESWKMQNHLYNRVCRSAYLAEYPCAAGPDVRLEGFNDPCFIKRVMTLIVWCVPRET